MAAKTTKYPTVIVCADIDDPDWHWLAPNLKDSGVRFEIVRCTATSRFEKNAFFNLARLRGSFRAISLARKTRSSLVVAHGPTLAAWCALFGRLLAPDVRILGYSFNFALLPKGIKRWVFALALSRVERFVVFSSMERKLYADTFSLPLERFDFVRWAVRPPTVESPDVPIENGRYVCALGGNARDYRTLVAAAQQMPDVRFILVVRPHNLIGLDLPANVKAYANIPFERAMNILLHSQFMVLPLVGSEVPCGHVTLVAAMHLGKTFVVTDSAGVSDYVQTGENGFTVKVGDAGNLTATTLRLWNDPQLCVELGNNGQRFAIRECSENRMVEHFRSWLSENFAGIACREAKASS